MFAELIIKNSEICYNQFGAYGDGEHDDFIYLRKAHLFANTNNYNVIGYIKSTYYLHYVVGDYIPIQTNVDWKNAHFIIDDSDIPLANRQQQIFWILHDNGMASREDILSQIPTLTSLSKKQKTILELAGRGDIFVKAINSNKKIYIRRGVNQNNGADLSDIFRVTNEGEVVDDIQWDFTALTNLYVRPIDPSFLTIKNGIFTTIINSVDSYSYYDRGIRVDHDNVTLKNITHYLSGENERTQSSPYHAFIYSWETSNLTLKDCFLSGHKWWKDSTSGAAKGTYDFQTVEDIDLTLDNVRQLNSISTKDYWSTFAGNNSKNLTLKNCWLNRFGSHMGFYNFTIKDSTIGCRGMGFMGGGIGIFENVQVLRNEFFVELKEDYGCSFDGEFHIKNCSLLPVLNNQYHQSIFASKNDAKWDFGFPCVLPDLYIDNFTFFSTDEDIKHQFSIIDVVTTNLSTNINYDADYATNAINQVYPQTFHKKIEAKHIHVENVETDRVYLCGNEGSNLWNFYMASPGYILNFNTTSASNDRITDVTQLTKTNTEIYLEDIDFNTGYNNYNNTRCSLIGTASWNNNNQSEVVNYRFIPKITIKNNKTLIYLGMSGRPAKIYAENCPIALAYAGYGGVVTEFHLTNCKILLNYFGLINNNHNILQCSYRSLTLENCHYEKTDNTGEVNDIDILTYEFPFNQWVSMENGAFYRGQGNYKNLSYWQDLYTLMKDENSYSFWKNGFDKYGINTDYCFINHSGYIVYPCNYGTTNTRPSSTYPLKRLPLGFQYFDTTLNKVVYFKENNIWVDSMGNIV